MYIFTDVNNQKNNVYLYIKKSVVSDAEPAFFYHFFTIQN
jgi:hypothetical protein